MRKLRRTIGLTILVLFGIGALVIFLLPIYFAFVNHDALQMFGMFVTWIPAAFVFYMGVFLAAIFDI